ncbi:hypothetical protein DL96DRAFT_1595385 [Flagelloscypha sp. PMI_526]|nr:hypothetical protein DL96DRAFT_1595385 [Flagelloscypha sp. PMI_526]
MDRILLPDYQYLITSGFTTCSDLAHNHVATAALDDPSLGVYKVSNKTTHRIVCPPKPAFASDDETLPSPSSAWEAFYPKGSINPSAEIPGGFSFYLAGPSDFAAQLEHGVDHAMFSYRMMLQDGWDPVKGGKLPGIFGGERELSYRCTGGRQKDRCKCFNIRPMWRAGLAGEMYAYLPLTEHNKSQLEAVPPESRENGDYGFSVGRNAFNFRDAIGRWISVAFRVKLNQVGQTDGELQLWINGASVISANNLQLRSSDDAKIKGMHFQTFFGGHTPDWASPTDQYAWFTDVTGAVLG